MWKRLKIFTARVTGPEYLPRYSRLAGELDSYEPLLEKRITDTKSQDEEWAKQAKILLNKSWKLLDKTKIDEAWKVFHTAKRLEIYGYSDNERIAYAKSLVEEVSKLNEWRRSAIQSLLGNKKEDIKTAPGSEILIMAVELKDDYYNNQYYKNKLSRNLFRLLFTLLFIVIAAIIAYFIFNIHPSGEKLDEVLTPTGYLIGVLLFGFLGAITSSILFTRYMSKFSRITEIGSSSVITISKIFVGAAFSVFIYLLLNSSIAESIKIFSFTIEDPIDYFAVAFVSGFSEQFAQKAIVAIVGKEENEPAAKKPKTES